MIAKVPTNCQAMVDILNAAFEQIKKECDITSGTIADKYESYANMVDALETALRLWRALDDNYDSKDGVVIEIHPQ